MILRLSSLPIAAVVAACLLMAREPCAQGRVHKVDPTSATAFATIGAAITAAAPGDVIVVSTKPPTAGVLWSNLYPAIRIDKSLSITSEGGHDVRCWSAEIVALGDQDRVVIRGLRFERPTLLVGFGLPTLSVAGSRGHVFLEDCTFQPASPLVAGVGATFPAIDIQGPTMGPRGSVTLVRCAVRGIGGVNNPRSAGQQSPAPGICAVDTDLAIWDSTVAGGQGVSAYPQLSLPAGAGAEGMVFDGYAFASGSVFLGGAGGSANTGSCGTGGNGGDGIALAQAATLVEALACTFAGGNGGGGCPGGANGAAVVRGAATLAHQAGVATAIEATSPHRVGQTTTLTHTGVQGGLYFALAGTTPAFLRTTPLGLPGVLHLTGPGATVPLYAGTYGAGGQTLLPVFLPPTGREGTVILLQTVAFTLPGTFTVSAPTALFVLAAHL